MDFIKIDLSKTPEKLTKFVGTLFLDNQGLEGKFISYAKHETSRTNVNRIIFGIDCNLPIWATASIFPNVEVIVIESNYFESLEGIGEHKNLKSIIIDKEKKNASFNFDELQGITLDYLAISYLSKRKAKILELPANVNHLRLDKCDVDDFSVAKDINLSSLKLTKCKSKTIIGLDLLPINELHIHSCRNLIDFTPIQKLERLYIENCQSVDFKAISQYVNTREIFVSHCKQSVCLEIFLSMNVAHKMEINNSGVIVKGSERLPENNIKELVIFPIGNDVIEKLLTHNPGRDIRG